MYNCRYCNKQFEVHCYCMAHERLCKLNPDFFKVRILCSLGGKSVKNHKKFLVERKTYSLICSKCGKHFEKIMSVTEFERKNNRFFCSKSCANSRNHSKETREKMSKSQLEFIRKSRHEHLEKETRYCKICNSELLHKNKSGYSDSTPVGATIKTLGKLRVFFYK